VAAKLNVVTGATGLLGSHLVEQLIGRGERVRALVRPGSDVRLLQQLGVQLFPGDLTEPASLPGLVEGADVVYHCAARVGDWGPWKSYQTHILDATRHLLAACRSVGVGRVLHVSSIGVYGHLGDRDRPITESEPLGQNPWFWDYYPRAKLLAERMCRRYPGALTIVRPTWLYGPYDRNTLPRVVKAVTAGRVAVIGRGDNKINIVYAGDVADGCIRAAEHPGAVGQAYNLSSLGELTQRQFIDRLTAELRLPSVRKHVSFLTAFWGGFLSECIGRAINLRRPPHITRHVVSLVGRSTRFSIDKARKELGWEPRVGVEEGMRRTLEWYSGHTAEQNGAAGAGVERAPAPVKPAHPPDRGPEDSPGALLPSPFGLPERRLEPEGRP
jgi:nucleoside-diphosphate-sugar epimerase